MKNYAAGVDVGGTAIKIGIFDKEGKILEKWEIPTKTDGGSSAIFRNIAESLTGKMEELGIQPKEMIGIGMGVPASITRDGHMAKAVNVGWDEMYPAKELEKLIHIPVKAANDANVAAFGEMWQGAARGYDNVLMVTLGTGVGGGIISEGTIICGADGGGGEIGHIHVSDAETVPCNCGQKGCLEQYASATGVVRLASMRLAKAKVHSRLHDLNVSEITAKDVFDAAKEKDPEALLIVQEFGRFLAKGLGILCSTVNPRAVVIGGGMSKAGRIIIENIEPYFKEYVFPPCSHVEFLMAELGNDAGICGAAGMIIKSGGNP